MTTAMLFKSKLWTTLEDDILRANYRTGSTQKIISEILNRTGRIRSMAAIRCRASFIGVSAAATERKNWTVKDDELLSDIYPNHPMSYICRRLGRSTRAITQRACKLGISRQDRDNCYTQTEVCRILGIGEDRFRYFTKNGLKVRELHSRALLVDRDSLKDFIIKHSFELSGRNVDLFQMVNILVGDR